MTRLAVWTVAPGSKVENSPVLGFARYRECTGTDQIELGTCAGRQNLTMARNQISSAFRFIAECV